MGKLKILAKGDSPQSRNNLRGHLFEQLMIDVLRELNINIYETANRVYAGMEIDIEGKDSIHNTPIYAECKFYTDYIPAPKLHTFFGKFVARWFKDQSCRGLFFAIPDLNPNAKAFYEVNMKNIEGVNISIEIKSEKDVLDLLYKSNIVCSPEIIDRSIPKIIGTFKDKILIYTNRGVFWFVLIIPPGGGIVEKLIIADSKGNFISSDSTIEYLRGLDYDDELFNEKEIVKIPHFHKEIQPYDLNIGLELTEKTGSGVSKIFFAAIRTLENLKNSERFSQCAHSLKEVVRLSAEFIGYPPEELDDSQLEEGKFASEWKKILLVLDEISFHKKIIDNEVEFRGVLNRFKELLAYYIRKCE